MSNNGPLYRECIACGIIIEKPFWLCQTCEDTHGVLGVPSRLWPRFLKDMYNMAMREERRARRFELMLLEERGDGAQDIEGRSLRHTGYPVPKNYDPDMEWGLLRYAPYADDEQNRAYRRSNNIAER